MKAVGFSEEREWRLIFMPPQAPLATSAEAFSEARKIVDNKVEGPRR
jgi:hypothetical protein